MSSKTTGTDRQRLAELTQRIICEKTGHYFVSLGGLRSETMAKAFF